jgi:adenosine deaminase
VNSDDPAFLGVDLLGEYERCIEAFGWDTAVVRDVATTSIAASFASDDMKRTLLEEVATWRG